MRFVIDHLSKHFEKKEVLKEITFTFEEGKIYGLLGRNGAGKTTLFNCLNRDIRADGGTFFLDENGTPREISAEDIGYVLSTPTVPEFLTGREFLKFFLDINASSIKNLRSLDECLYRSLPLSLLRPCPNSLERPISSGYATLFM